MFHPRLISSLLLVAFAPIAMGLGGCGTTGQNAASHALKTPELPTDKQAKCKIAKSQAEPLIVEWPDAARGRLESVARKGLVAVRYEGCELAVLPRCTVKSNSGGYSYSPITRKQSKVVIKDADELYASMPVGAVKLESKLQSAGQLNVQMTIVGRFESATPNIYREDLEGDCSEATHVIAALTVGSFTFSAGSDAEIGGGASTVLPGVGGGAKSSASRETIQHDGDEAACTRSTIADKSPPEGCGALLQIEVMPLAKGAKAVAAVVVPVPIPSPMLPPAPPPDPSLAEKPASTKPPKCKKGERVEDGVCVKPGARVTGAAVKPIKPTKPSIASASVTCSAGQHSWNGRCVDDEAVQERTPPPPPPPAPPTPTPTSCLAGTHLENGACVIDPMATTPASYSSYNPDGTPKEADGPNPWRTVLVYVAIGTGLSAATFGIAALGAAGKAADGCDSTGKTCSQDAADQRDKAKTYALITDVSLGLTVLSVLGIFLVPSHKVKVSAAPTPNGVAASASWRF